MKRAFFILMILFTGCSLAPDYQRPDLELGAKLKSAPAPDKIAADWWKDFNSPTLNQLIDAALAHNTDIQASLQRIEEARAQARIANASLLPHAEASGSRGRSSTDPEKGPGVVSDNGRGSIDVSYELDLFGANRSKVEASESRLQASQFSHEALTIVTAAEVANGYAAVLAESERLRIAKEDLGVLEQVMSIIQAQYDAGRVSQLELSQQKAALADARAAIAGLERDHQTLLNALAVLVGVVPQNFELAEEKLSALKIPPLKDSISALLIEQRPDIRAAEASLKAANADIGAARAAFFPSMSISLSAAMTLNPAAFLTDIAASALAPIFSGGALEGNLELSQAQQLELAAAYRKAVLTSFQEAGDALMAADAASKRVEARIASRDANQKAFDLAHLRYKSGAIDFQSLLTIQRDKLNADDVVAQADLERAQAAINLIKALGGGWKENPAAK
jgi:NodT family efflux transporter outer membrane factor (OMF) lipoprotein